MLYRKRNPSNPWSEFEESNGRYADSTILDVGDELGGTLVDIQLGADGYGVLCRVCTILSSEDRCRRTIWLYHRDLKRQFAEIKPALGNYIRIRRLENVGRRHRYELTVDRQSAAGELVHVGL